MFKTSKELCHQDIAVLVNSVLKSLYLLSIFTHTQNAPGDLRTRYQTTLYVSGKLPPPPPILTGGVGGQFPRNV